MKKVLLTTLSLAVVASTYGQQQVGKVKIAPEHDVAMPANQVQLTGIEYMPLATPSQAVKPTSVNQSKALSETIVGESFYDLESNSSVQNRLVRHSDGTTSASWTYSNETGGSYTDRGTGYNYEDASDTWGSIPLTRVETQRTGWPSMMTTTGGTEIVISHGGSGGYVMNARNPKGSGAWTESIVPAPSGQWMLWPRATTGGVNGNSVHMIGISAPTGNGGVLYEGLDGALLYWRSLDQGATWDQQEVQLTGIDSSNYVGFRADAYAIATEGDVIAIGLFNQWADMVLLKSTDNGSNWTSSIIRDFPIDKFVVDDGSDWDNNGSFDTLTTCDEAGALILDASGQAHVFYGNMRVMDDDLTDGNTSYFPGTSGMMYWVEGTAANGAVMIADVEDLDNDGELGWAGDWALYYTSLTGFPNAGVDAQGNLYLTYAGYNELYSNGSQNYRHIYVMSSSDGGSTWGDYIDVTPDVAFDGLECVFPSMAPAVDDKVRILYMRDYEPGLAVRGDQDPVSLNEFIYLCIDKDFYSGVEESELENAQLELYPNPASNQVNAVVSLEAGTNASIKVYDFLGQEVATVMSGKMASGTQQFSINLDTYSEGVYFISLVQNNARITQKLIVTK